MIEIPITRSPVHFGKLNEELKDGLGDVFLGCRANREYDANRIETGNAIVTVELANEADAAQIATAQSIVNNHVAGGDSQWQAEARAVKAILAGLDGKKYDDWTTAERLTVLKAYLFKVGVLDRKTHIKPFDSWT